MSGRLAGKVALISGTAGGQGRCAALRFAREGARVVGCDVQGDAARETVELVRAAGGVGRPTTALADAVAASMVRFDGATPASEREPRR
jgi:NAD(P)-dependent dehydrogenase (short-subunit alcohol dehydrogenase family)